MVSKHGLIRLESSVVSAIEFPKIWEYVYCVCLMLGCIEREEESIVALIMSSP
jgi:hypothetical protein